MSVILIVLMVLFTFQIVGCGPTGEFETTAEYTASSIELQISDASIDADGSSRSNVTATVKTSTNQAVPNAAVTFETTRGSITSPNETDEYGQAVAEVISDRYNDSNVIITARCQEATGTLSIAFTGIDLSLEAEPDNLLADGSTTSTITGTLNDAAFNPIPAATVNFSADRGTLSASSVTTDSSGEVQVSLTSSDAGTATVTAVGAGVTGTIGIEFTLNLFSLAPSSATIRVGATSTITATLSGSNVSGQTVTFSTTLGTLSSNAVVTNANGVASVTLTAGTNAGLATINASVTVSGVEYAVTTQVTVTGGSANKIVLSAAPNVIAIDDGEATITARVFDATEQPAANQTIFFQINSGPSGGEYLATSQKTTNSVGITTVQFFAGSLSSTLGGVEIGANTKSDFTGSSGSIDLTISGPVTKIAVGQSMVDVEAVGGHLEVKVSAIATDVSGNPIPDSTKVNFSVLSVEFDEDRDDDNTINCWDLNGSLTCGTHYASTTPPVILTAGLGMTWFTDDVNLDGVLNFSGTEDTNGNAILDSGEDINDNGEIDPIDSAVITGSVETVNGVATATMTYPQSHAANVKVRVIAESGGVSNFYEIIHLCLEEMVEQGTCGIYY